MNTIFLKTASKRKTIHIELIQPHHYDLWLSNLSDHEREQIDAADFSGKVGQCMALYDESGYGYKIAAYVHAPLKLYDSALISAYIAKRFSNEALGSRAFALSEALDAAEATKFALGWGLQAYKFTDYKAASKQSPSLMWPQNVDKQAVDAQLSAITRLRDMVNMPANDFGPAELEAHVTQVADAHKAKLKVIKGAALVKGFPLVNAVGQAAAKGREPRLIQLSWGQKSDPKLTLVGKGVCFDTGGLDLKTRGYMGLMKKDMGGAAHALALASLVMAYKLPLQLTLIIPAVENSVAGAAFRPGDVFTSRSGLTVENVDTDAEGRLILADSLALAAEGKPDLVIDFATLTGSARAGLGQDVPAGFSNDAALEAQLREISAQVEDLVWPMPLHADYDDLLESDIADLHNHVSGTPGDLIYSALFLQRFLGKDAPRWIHVDCFAWESRGRPGRAKGGKDTGLRALWALVQSLYPAE